MKNNVINEELLEALKALVEKVEELSLWDKTDSAYYKAKRVIEKTTKSQKSFANKLANKFPKFHPPTKERE